MPDFSKRKIKNSLKSIFNLYNSNIPEPVSELINSLYRTIPNYFSDNQKASRISLKLVFTSIVVVVAGYLSYSVFVNQNNHSENNVFKPTKIIELNYPTFQPTKVVEINQADEIKKELR